MEQKMRVRSQLEIIEEFLNMCLEEQIAYHILRKVNPSTYNFKNYKKKLLKMKLIKTRIHHYHHRFKTTDEGKKFLQVILRLK